MSKKTRKVFFILGGVILLVLVVLVASSVLYLNGMNAELAKSLNVNGKSVTERQVAQEFRVTGFPTTCFLKPDGEKIACLPGYSGPGNFANVLSYIKDKAYEKEMRLDEYIKEKEQKKGKS